MIPKKFIPDLCLSDIYEISAEKLRSDGVKAVILDIDNTLVTYDDPKPTVSVLAWFEKLRENGIGIAFVSNNSPERVDLFNRDLGFPAFPDAKKPSPKYYKEAMTRLGVKPEETTAIGDQVFTDVFAAKRAGMRTIMVRPIKDKLTLLFRVKRKLEIPVLKKYAKIHKNDKK